MVNVSEITNLISNVGFPIVCTGGCVFVLYKLSNVILQLSVTLKGMETRLENIENVVLGEK